jgi:hypothetical protein
MAKTKNPTYDVFIAHTFSDRQLAEEVANILTSQGICVFMENRALEAGRSFEDTIWEAMAESRAFVAIISSSASWGWIAFELGAAKAWNKPIYVVTAEASLTGMPPGFGEMKLFPMSRVYEMTQLIAQSAEPLSQHDKDALLDAYAQVGIPLDQLASQPHQFARLIQVFNRNSKRRLAGEQLMSLLLRNRKQGLLPTLAKRERKRVS